MSLQCQKMQREVQVQPYILDEKNRKVLIPIDVNKVKDIDDEKGSESLGRPANDYVKNKLGDDNNSDVSIYR